VVLSRLLLRRLPALCSQRYVASFLAALSEPPRARCRHRKAKVYRDVPRRLG